MGLGVGLRGNYQIQGDNDTDDTLTITGASSSAAGDLFVLQNSTGTEFLSVTYAGDATFTGAFQLASSAVNGLTVDITSSGAIVSGATPSGFVVTTSSKSVLNTAFLLDQTTNAGTAAAGSVNALLGVHGSKAPTNFLQLGVSSTYGEGAAASSGFFSITHRLTSSASISTITAFATIAVMSGSYVFYIPCYPNTMVT